MEKKNVGYCETKAFQAKVHWNFYCFPDQNHILEWCGVITGHPLQLSWTSLLNDDYYAETNENSELQFQVHRRQNNEM